jgi:hypothetical protein
LLKQLYGRKIVRIIEWPKEPAILSHNFPKPVDINIPNPVGLNMFNTEERPLHLNMNLTDGKVLPVCIKLCEPICAESNYKIGITLMGQPFIEIALKGITRYLTAGIENRTRIIHRSQTARSNHHGNPGSCY